ncbi:hypothetical protein ACI65C_008977 [Semiaphis heraclei]
MLASRPIKKMSVLDLKKKINETVETERGKGPRPRPVVLNIEFQRRPYRGETNKTHRIPEYAAVASYKRFLDRGCFNNKRRHQLRFALRFGLATATLTIYVVVYTTTTTTIPPPPSPTTTTTRLPSQTHSDRHDGDGNSMTTSRLVGG